MKCRQAGLSLVELMVSAMLGLFLITGIAHLLLATNKSWALQDELSRVQENARMAVHILGSHIRRAAYTGCPSETSLANNISANHNARQWMSHFDKGLLGLQAGTDVKGYLDSQAISEAVIVHGINRNQSLLVSSHDTGTATLSLENNHDYDGGDLLALISKGCQQVSLFRAGADTDRNRVTHPISESGNLYNCTNHLKGHYNCHTSSAEAENLNHKGSELMPLNSYALYLRNSNGVPTLYRKQAGEYMSGNSINAEALMEGIEKIRLLYGEDTDQDGVVNQYRTAADLGLFSHQWKQVISVKLELLARSFREVAPHPQAYFFSGQRIVPNDLYIRRNFVATIELRNRTTAPE